MSRRLGKMLHWVRSAEGTAFLLLWGASLLLRLALAPFPGFAGDVQGYAVWGDWLLHHWGDFYSSGAHLHPIPAYPPLGIYLCGLMVGLYRLLCLVTGLTPTLEVTQSPLLVVLLKLPNLLAEQVTIALLYFLARKPLPPKRAWLVTASYAFSLPILFDGALWGQTDGLLLLPVLLALLCLLSHHPRWAGVALALALLLKPQSVLFVPLVVLWLWRWEGRRALMQMVLSAGLICLLGCFPYLLPPRPEVVAFAGDVSAWVAQAPYASNNAYNLWWLIGWNHQVATPFLGPLSPTSLGGLLFLLVLVVVLVRLWRETNPAALWQSAALLAIGWFVVTPLQHERYLYPALALLWVVALSQPSAWWAYGVATLTAFGNMAMVILLYSPPADLSQAVSAWRLTLVEHLGGLLVLLTILIAGGNLLLLFLVGRGTWRQARAQPRRPVLSVSAVAVALPSEQAQAVASPSARQKEPEL